MDDLSAAPRNLLIFWVRSLRDALVDALAVNESRGAELREAYAALDEARLLAAHNVDELTVLRGKVSRGEFAKEHHRLATERASKALDLLSRVELPA